jgi:hypothetical protein
VTPTALTTINFFICIDRNCANGAHLARDRRDVRVTAQEQALPTAR